METISTFFEVNKVLVYFIYGLVFFLLGAVIALQSRSYSRLDLARSLSWLAAFGFAHGLHEWGDFFIPIQATYLSPGIIELLHQLHLLLLAVSFAFLFEFGVTLLRPLGRMRWLHILPPTLLAVWIFVVYFPLPILLPDFNVWVNVSDALARYFICVPAGLLAGYGLRQHTYHRIAPLNVPYIVNMLRFAGVMLGLYALFSGLLVDPIPFFPGNVLNSQTFTAALGAPPPVFRSIVGLGLLVAIIRGLEIFNVETARMIESMQQQQILTSEHERLARELHDGAIQKVYTAGLLVQSAQKLAITGNEELSNRLERAVSVLHDAISDLRQNLNDLHASPSEDPLPDLLRKLAEDPRFRSLIDITLTTDLEGIGVLSPVRAEHVLSIVNEALSNVVRHARAGKVKITACTKEGRLKLTIQDDGVGIPRKVQPGYGLRNMRDRARLLGGQIEISNTNGKGALVSLDIPLVDER